MKTCLLLTVFILHGLFDADLATSNRKWNTPAEELHKLRDGLIQARKNIAVDVEKKDNEISRGKLLAHLLDGLDEEKQARNFKEPVAEDKKSADALKEFEKEESDISKDTVKTDDAPGTGVHDVADDLDHSVPVQLNEGDKVLTAENDDSSHDGDFDGATDDIFCIVSGLKDEIKAHCGIDLEATFSKFNPATLADANGALKKLQDATKELNDKLSATNDFADSLRKFVESSSYSDDKVGEQVNKTFKEMDKTLDPLNEKLFCAEAAVIVNRLQMSLFGGNGFAYGYLCNRFFVEMLKYDSNATKVLKAVASDNAFIKNYTTYLAEDITCYEKELETYNKIIPTSPFTGSSPLHVAAFTESFMVQYGMILLYHRVLLDLAGDILVEISCPENKDKSNDEQVEIDKKNMETTLDEDADSLTNQLQKLLKKLNDVSAKKKALEDSMTSRNFGGKPFQKEREERELSH